LCNKRIARKTKNPLPFDLVALWKDCTKKRKSVQVVTAHTEQYFDPLSKKPPTAPLRAAAHWQSRTDASHIQRVFESSTKFNSV
jgi:hypothetical protein